MIEHAITTTPITGGIADRVFSKIGGSAFRGDVSFTAVARAVLHDLIVDDDKFFFAPKRMDYTLRNMRSESVRDWFYRYGTNPNDMAHGTFQLMYIDRSESENKDEFIDLVVSKFLEEYQDDGWEQIKSVTDLFHSNCGVGFFVNRERHTVCMFMDKISMKLYHLMVCALPGMLPWYFTLGNGYKLPPKKKALLIALSKANTEEFLAILQEFADQFDFRAEQIKSCLTGFESVALRGQLDRDKNEITNRNRTIEDCRRRMMEEIKKKDDLLTRIAGLEFRLRSGEIPNHLMDYFLQNKTLYLVDTCGTEVTFIVGTYMSYFDEDKAQAVMDNRDSYLYTEQYGEITSDDMRRLMQGIFIDQDVKLKACAAYRVDANFSYRGLGDYSYPAEFNDYLRNPHIHHHSCLGGYDTQIADALGAHNMVGAVDACCQSARSINLNESASARYMVDDLYDNSIKCIELPDGKCVLPSEAIEWLKKQDEEG